MFEQLAAITDKDSLAAMIAPVGGGASDAEGDDDASTDGAGDSMDHPGKADPVAESSGGDGGRMAVGSGDEEPAAAQPGHATSVVVRRGVAAVEEEEVESYPGYEVAYVRRHRILGSAQQGDTAPASAAEHGGQSAAGEELGLGDDAAMTNDDDDELASCEDRGADAGTGNGGSSAMAQGPAGTGADVQASTSTLAVDASAPAAATPRRAPRPPRSSGQLTAFQQLQQDAALTTKATYALVERVRKLRQTSTADQATRELELALLAEGKLAAEQRLQRLQAVYVTSQNERELVDRLRREVEERDQHIRRLSRQIMLLETTTSQGGGGPGGTSQPQATAWEAREDPGGPATVDGTASGVTTLPATASEEATCQDHAEHHLASARVPGALENLERLVDHDKRVMEAYNGSAGLPLLGGRGWPRGCSHPCLQYITPCNANRLLFRRIEIGMKKALASQRLALLAQGGQRAQQEISKLLAGDDEAFDAKAEDQSWALERL